MVLSPGVVAGIGGAANRSLLDLVLQVDCPKWAIFFFSVIISTLPKQSICYWFTSEFLLARLIVLR